MKLRSNPTGFLLSHTHTAIAWETQKGEPEGTKKYWEITERRAQDSNPGNLWAHPKPSGA